MCPLRGHFRYACEDGEWTSPSEGEFELVLLLLVNSCTVTKCIGHYVGKLKTSSITRTSHKGKLW